MSRTSTVLLSALVPAVPGSPAGDRFQRARRRPRRRPVRRPGNPGPSRPTASPWRSAAAPARASGPPGRAPAAVRRTARPAEVAVPRPGTAPLGLARPRVPGNSPPFPAAFVTGVLSGTRGGVPPSWSGTGGRTWRGHSFGRAATRVRACGQGDAGHAVLPSSTPQRRRAVDCQSGGVPTAVTWRRRASPRTRAEFRVHPRRGRQRTDRRRGPGHGTAAGGPVDSAGPTRRVR